MTYQIELRPAAERALRNIDARTQARIRGAIALLANDPRPPNSRRLTGRPELRLRIGDHRILYTVDHGVLLVIVITVGHRREIHDR